MEHGSSGQHGHAVGPSDVPLLAPRGRSWQWPVCTRRQAQQRAGCRQDALLCKSIRDELEFVFHDIIPSAFSESREQTAGGEKRTKPRDKPGREAQAKTTKICCLELVSSSQSSSSQAIRFLVGSTLFHHSFAPGSSQALKRPLSQARIVRGGRIKTRDLETPGKVKSGVRASRHTKHSRVPVSGRLGIENTTRLDQSHQTATTIVFHVCLTTAQSIDRLRQSSKVRLFR